MAGIRPRGDAAARRLHPATRADVEAEARRQRVPRRLLNLLGRMPGREHVSPEDVADESAR
jgi:hypothetical protein